MWCHEELRWHTQLAALARLTAAFKQDTCILRLDFLIAARAVFNLMKEMLRLKTGHVKLIAVASGGGETESRAFLAIWPSFPMREATVLGEAENAASELVILWGQWALSSLGHHVAPDMMLLLVRSSIAPMESGFLAVHYGEDGTSRAEYAEELWCQG
ncbi:hypothetical protein AOLI_G00023650 [Acnodon oligacanthus]